MVADITVRNLDPEAYRALKARAASEGRPIGEALSQAIREYVSRPREGRRNLSELPVIDLGPGTQDLGDEIDRLAYGRSRT
jgi:plasmid stability protein